MISVELSEDVIYKIVDNQIIKINDLYKIVLSEIREDKLNELGL
jgi:hypothetical protein